MGSGMAKLRKSKMSLVKKIITNFNCKTKNSQTQIENRGLEIQIWDQVCQIQIGAGAS